MNPDKIFDAFFTTKKEGLGIGLSLCRSIIDSHGGHLWFTAAQPVGSTFHFTLPAHLINKRAPRRRRPRG
jgi:signal transduction histidine kinase